MQGSEQEEFWRGSFGDAYTARNRAERWVPGETALFARILARTQRVRSVLEFGANVGLNLQAIRNLLPEAELSGIEINQQAASELERWGHARVYHQSLLDFTPDYRRDLVLTKGVLIHLDPACLPEVYAKLVASAERYVCLAEYYNPAAVEISYRGHAGKLFKRDFAGEMLDGFASLRLLDYGFVYHRDPNFPQDDLTWFLLEKTDGGAGTSTGTAGG